jgi:hypothetical protein
MKRLLPFPLLFCALTSEVRAASAPIPAVPAWSALPFFLLLLAIAVVPLIHRRWWEKYYAGVSLGLGFLVFAYYILNLNPHRMLETGRDYFSFIVLIGSL